MCLLERGFTGEGGYVFNSSRFGGGGVRVLEREDNWEERFERAFMVFDDNYIIVFNSITCMIPPGRMFHQVLSAALSNLPS